MSCFPPRDNKNTAPHWWQASRGGLADAISAYYLLYVIHIDTGLGGFYMHWYCAVYAIGFNHDLRDVWNTKPGKLKQNLTVKPEARGLYISHITLTMVKLFYYITKQNLL